MRHRSVRNCACLGLTTAMILDGLTTHAQELVDEIDYDIDIPSLNAADALNGLLEQTGAIMLYPYDLAKARQANAASGLYTLMVALRRLLESSGLSGDFSDERVIEICLDETGPRNNLEAGVGQDKKRYGDVSGVDFCGTGGGSVRHR